MCCKRSSSQNQKISIERTLQRSMRQILFSTLKSNRHLLARQQRVIRPASSLSSSSNYSHSFSSSAASDYQPLTENEVIELQAQWGNAIKKISKTYLEQGDYISVAADAAAELYGYGHSSVLFKPTKAAEHPFRPTGGEAMSYFVGGSVVDGGYEEDAGFAINGGKGWKNVVFENHQIDLNGPVAIAMGSYVFTCATTNDDVKVEYTFGYKRNEDGNARIFLHHSSVPYQH